MRVPQPKGVRGSLKWIQQAVNLKLSQLSEKLREFWPRGGPHWDALARSAADDVLLVEAEAHIEEMCSTPCAAGEGARNRIEAALAATACLAALLQPPPFVEEAGRRRCQQLGDHICTASSCRRPWR